MITDPARIHKTDLGHPEVCVVHKYHEIYNLKQLADIEEKCRAGKIGCVACKKELMVTLDALLTPIRERKQKILSRPGYIDEVLQEGIKTARHEAAKTMILVREAMCI
jgi:tryptophanyl-tRNA synthetase